jgi:hypothetical protein
MKKRSIMQPMARGLAVPRTPIVHAPPPIVVQPIPVYDAPNVPLPDASPVSNVSDDAEVARIDAIPWPRSKQVSVYTTQRRWRAIDVYVQTSEANPAAGIIGGQSAVSGNLLTVFVYAINRGMRTVIASGRRYIYDDANVPPWPLHIAAARALAERFEVVTHLRQAAAAGNLAGTISVSVLASDESTEPRANVGAFMANGAQALSGLVFGGAGSTLAPAPFELLAISAVNDAGAGAPRWVHVYDTTNVANDVTLNGSFPLFAYALPEEGTSEGQPLIIDTSALPKFVYGPRVVASSTPGATTAAGDVFLNAMVR